MLDDGEGMQRAIVPFLLFFSYNTIHGCVASTMQKTNNLLMKSIYEFVDVFLKSKQIV
jgi:hypothetical protein